jgi:predicted DNA-binding transcriptional regulator AlpA
MRFEMNNTDTPRLLRWRQVAEIFPFSRSYVYELISQNKFPRPVKLVRGGQAAGWWASDIHAYMTNLQEQTRGASDSNCLNNQPQQVGWQGE